jgi:hypothetical protein
MLMYYLPPIGPDWARGATLGVVVIIISLASGFLLAVGGMAGAELYAWLRWGREQTRLSLAERYNTQPLDEAKGNPTTEEVNGAENRLQEG